MKKNKILGIGGLVGSLAVAGLVMTLGSVPLAGVTPAMAQTSNCYETCSIAGPTNPDCPNVAPIIYPDGGCSFGGFCTAAGSNLAPPSCPTISNTTSNGN